MGCSQSDLEKNRLSLSDAGEPSTHFIGESNAPNEVINEVINTTKLFIKTANSAEVDGNGGEEGFAEKNQKYVRSASSLILPYHNLQSALKKSLSRIEKLSDDFSGNISDNTKIGVVDANGNVQDSSKNDIDYNITKSANNDNTSKTMISNLFIVKDCQKNIVIHSHSTNNFASIVDSFALEDCAMKELTSFTRNSSYHLKQNRFSSSDNHHKENSNISGLFHLLPPSNSFSDAESKVYNSSENIHNYCENEKNANSKSKHLFSDLRNNRLNLGKHNDILYTEYNDDDNDFFRDFSFNSKSGNDLSLYKSSNTQGISEDEDILRNFNNSGTNNNNFIIYAYKPPLAPRDSFRGLEDNCSDSNDNFENQSSLSGDNNIVKANYNFSKNINTKIDKNSLDRPVSLSSLKGSLTDIDSLLNNDIDEYYYNSINRKNTDYDFLSQWLESVVETNIIKAS